MKTLTGAIQFEDIGAGQFYLVTDDARYRLVFSFASHETFTFLKTTSHATAVGSVPDSTVVTGGTSCPVMIVTSVS
jgi:hypothetical protein